MCALPFTASAKPIGTFDFIVADPGDQVDPSIDGQFVVYAGPGPAGDGLDVFLYDLQTGKKQTIAGGAGDQDSPEVYLNTAIYRTPLGIVIESWPAPPKILREPPAGGDGFVANPAVHSHVAAWEHRSFDRSVAGDLDIVVTRYPAAPYVLRAPGDLDPAGDQHAPAVFDDLVAYVDDARQGSVWLHDSLKGPANWTEICELPPPQRCRPASGVSVGFDGTRYVIAVARSAGATGDDIEIYDRDGALLQSLSAPGPRRNPHLSGDWVAFDDYSGPFSQVAVWRWKTPPGEQNLVFVPHPTETNQRLNDLSMALSDEVRVVFEDTAPPRGGVDSGRDIALYKLPVNPIAFDGQPNGWPIAPAPADCKDPNATPLATLELVRAHGKPSSRSVPFDVAPPPGRDELPVLVCIHAEHVSSASVILDDDAVARPDDFDAHDVDLSIPAEVEAGRRRLSAVLAGKPGAVLTVRVLADPARADACKDDDDDDEHGHDGDDDGRDEDGEHHGKRVRHRDCRGRGERREGGTGGTGGADAAAGTGAPDAPDAPARPAYGGGGCGSGGELASLASLALLLARRKLRA
ncbi:MAG TPA: hypothetical protein VIW03_07210 [Anaeromyxobacter sp.]